MREVTQKPKPPTHTWCSHEIGDSLTPPCHVECFVHVDNSTNLLEIKKTECQTPQRECLWVPDAFLNVPTRKSKLSEGENSESMPHQAFRVPANYLTEGSQRPSNLMYLKEADNVGTYVHFTEEITGQHVTWLWS